MSVDITFSLDPQLKAAIEELKRSGKDVDLELRGSIVNGELKIKQLDSVLAGGAAAPHCWHVLTDNAKA